MFFPFWHLVLVLVDTHSKGEKSKGIVDIGMLELIDEFWMSARCSFATEPGGGGFKYVKMFTS